MFKAIARRAMARHQLPPMPLCNTCRCNSCGRGGSCVSRLFVSLLPGRLICCAYFRRSCRATSWAKSPAARVPTNLPRARRRRRAQTTPKCCTHSPSLASACARPRWRRCPARQAPARRRGVHPGTPVLPPIAPLRISCAWLAGGDWLPCHRPQVRCVGHGNLPARPLHVVQQRQLPRNAAAAPRSASTLRICMQAVLRLPICGQARL